MTTQDAKRKVQALLRTADPKNGATEHERSTAKALAVQLAERFGFRLENAGQPGIPVREPAFNDIGEFVFNDGRGYVRVNLRRHFTISVPGTDTTGDDSWSFDFDG